MAQRSSRTLVRRLTSITDSLLGETKTKPGKELKMDLSRMKTRNKALSERFCRCIKSVRKTVKVRGKDKSKAAKEQAAIAICVNTVLKRRGKTLKKFQCLKKPYLKTQRLIKK